MSEYGYVYIMASTFKRLYIGVTSELAVRVQRHKQHLYPESFTARYNIDRLVYFERFGLMDEAIARETQLKKWSRLKKIRLIVENNPTWRDLSEEWGSPVALYTTDAS